jgi:hypothetical protein
MGIVLQIENLSTRKIKKIELKDGGNAVKLPKGSHVRVVDKATGKEIAPDKAIRVGDDIHAQFTADGHLVDIQFIEGARDSGQSLPQGDVSLAALGQALPAFDAFSDASAGTSALTADAGAGAAAPASGGGVGTTAYVLLGLGAVGGGIAAAAGGSWFFGWLRFGWLFGGHYRRRDCHPGAGAGCRRLGRRERDDRD